MAAAWSLWARRHKHTGPQDRIEKVEKIEDFENVSWYLFRDPLDPNDRHSSGAYLSKALPRKLGRAGFDELLKAAPLDAIMKYDDEDAEPDVIGVSAMCNAATCVLKVYTRGVKTERCLRDDLEFFQNQGDPRFDVRFNRNVPKKQN